MTLDQASASGKKARKQKGSGRARQGQRQKSGWYKGVKAHGRKVRSLRIEMPAKVRLQALKVAFTAALWDGRVRVVESEAMQSSRTRDLERVLRSTMEQNETVLVVVGSKVDESFSMASRNLEYVKVCLANRVNVLKLLETKQILITKDGLQELTTGLMERTSR